MVQTHQFNVSPYGGPNWGLKHKDAPKVPNITIGCDPEVFLRNKATGKMVSAHDLLPGTKLKPHPVQYGAVQVDGLAAEININPTTDSVQWTLLLGSVIEQLKGMVPGHDLQIIPAYEWDRAYFDTLPENAKTLGCDPDFNAWTGEQNPAPNGMTTLRGCGGHVHMGGWADVKDPYDSLHFQECCAHVKQMEYYVCIYSLLWDTDSRRRSQYGLSGSFRPKPYGVELRTLSNMWLRYPKLHPWIWNAVYNSAYSMYAGKPRLYEEFGDLARQVIDNNNVEFVRSDEFKKIHKMTGQPWPQW